MALSGLINPGQVKGNHFFFFPRPFWFTASHAITVAGFFLFCFTVSSMKRTSDVEYKSGCNKDSILVLLAITTSQKIYMCKKSRCFFRGLKRQMNFVITPSQLIYQKFSNVSHTHTQSLRTVLGLPWSLFVVVWDSFFRLHIIKNPCQAKFSCVGCWDENSPLGRISPRNRQLVGEVIWLCSKSAHLLVPELLWIFFNCSRSNSVV